MRPMPGIGWHRALRCTLRDLPVIVFLFWAASLVTSVRQRRAPEGLLKYKPPPLPELPHYWCPPLSDQQISDLLDERIDDLRAAAVISPHGKSDRVRNDFRANVITTYAEYRKSAKARQNAQGYTGSLKMAKALYSGVENMDDAHDKSTSMGRWNLALVIIGVLALEPVKDRNGAYRGRVWRLCSPERRGLPSLMYDSVSCSW
jgi:hypothetical protein